MKVLISGTPFHYGRALVSYNPLSGFDQVTIERGLGGALDADLVGFSEATHIFKSYIKCWWSFGNSLFL
jgi:hypothetical protein